MAFYGRRMIPEPLLRELLAKRYTHVVKCSVDNINFTITTNFEYETTPDGYVEISKERFDELQAELNQEQITD